MLHEPHPVVARPRLTNAELPAAHLLDAELVPDVVSVAAAPDCPDDTEPALVDAVRDGGLGRRSHPNRQAGGDHPGGNDPSRSHWHFHRPLSRGEDSTGELAG